MYRTHTCGELKLSDVGKKVVLSGWIQRSRDLGGMTFIDLRDRYGITQLAFNMDTNKNSCEEARKLGREFVVQVEGTVTERHSKNTKIPTGEVEIFVDKITILNPAELPPFTIENDTDGGEELRMKYRYLDIRRNPIREALILRHTIAQEARKYLSQQQFLEVETPVLIKSTPEGARDFIVPSRMNAGQFYALPQSPQTFKQLLMVAGIDRYFQIVKCFRDEDLRADRQPEFTQIDCEMSFVEQEDILNMFEGLIKHLFQKVLGEEFEGPFPRMTYDEAMNKYGNDKPDIRFGMQIIDLTNIIKGKGFEPFDKAEYIGGICCPSIKEGFYTSKFGNDIRDFARKPQIGAETFIYGRYQNDGTLLTSIDKFYTHDDKLLWTNAFLGKPGECLLLVAGEKKKSLRALSEIRLEMGTRLNLRDKNTFAPLWVLDFPLLEWDEEAKRFFAMHHPFTSPKPEDIAMLDTNPGKVRANAYDMVINGVEVGGGSIRIHDQKLQKKMFKTLGFTDEDAEAQFGFLMNAFRFGAPPHGGIAFGFDRLTSLFAGLDSIRDVIAFPKNNSGRDIMIDSPAPVAKEALNDLSLSVVKKG